MHLKISFFAAFLIFLNLGIHIIHAGDDSRHNIPWQFTTYLEPDFRSEKQAVFAPQAVQLIESRDDGWALIDTAHGSQWVYLRANRRYIDRPTYLYYEQDGERGPRIEEQVVSILEEDGYWLQIETWLGPKWLYANPTPTPIGIRIAFTFDDGPSIHTSRLLDALAYRDISATFFVLGHQVTAHPDLAARIVADGHEIASHAYLHRVLTDLSADWVRDDLQQASNSILHATGTEPALFRPPYGEYNQMLQDIAAEFGYPIIMWSVDTRDWESRNVDAILSHFIDQNGVRLRDGDIILLHDIHSTSVDAAIQAIDLLLAEGVIFMTVSELLTEHYGTLTPGMIYSGYTYTYDPVIVVASLLESRH